MVVADRNEENGSKKSDKLERSRNRSGEIRRDRKEEVIAGRGEIIMIKQIRMERAIGIGV